jgi:hypothetical protein
MLSATGEVLESRPQNESVVGAGNCPNNLNHNIIFDADTTETICSDCGTVIQSNAESLESEWLATKEGIESKNRTGMPTSLAFHDMGLSTTISFSNMDANGVAISQDQRGKIQRLRRCNNMSTRLTTLPLITMMVSFFPNVVYSQIRTNGTQIWLDRENNMKILFSTTPAYVFCKCHQKIA